MASPSTDRRLGIVGNTAYKVPATVAATANIVQSGEQAVDGVPVKAINAAGVPDRVLCVGMTDATKNGLWDVQTSAWTRSIDSNGNYDLVKGTQVYIAQGTNAAGLVYVLTTANPITIGATALSWSPSLTNGLPGFTQAGVGAVQRTLQSKARDIVSVLDFGADSTGVADSTAAFNNANATGKGVFAPKGTYSVSDIAVVDGMNVFGECDPRVNAGSASTILQVRTNGTAAFRNSVASAGFISGIRIADMRIEAAAGITTARAYRQTNKDAYLAYSGFERIETSKNLQIGYDGFFIFMRWVDCRDGYVGTAPGGQQHWAIDSNPVSTGQTFQTNHNQVVRCQFFNSTAGAVAAVDIQYGSNWTFDSCDFEQLLSPAVRARGVFQGHFSNCWFEAITANKIVQLIDCAAPNAQSCTNWGMTNCFGYLANTTVEFVNMGGNAGIAVWGGGFLGVPAGVVFTATPNAVRTPLIGFSAISGAGSAGFLANILSVGLNQNVLPVGPINLGGVVGSFTNNGFTAMASGASDVGLTNAIKLTLSNAGNVAYYALPADMVTFLKGKTVTLCLFARPDTTGAETLAAAVWDSVGVPAFGNETAVASGQAIDVTSATLQVSAIQITVGAAATSLRVGVRAGGNANTKIVSLESMKLMMGYIVPAAAGLN